MADELQALLDRINQEGVAKADEQREKIVSEARQEADRLIHEARTKADGIVSDAREQADLLAEKGRASLQQAARDTLLSLRQALQDRMQTVARECIGTDVSPEKLADVIGEMAVKYTEVEGKVKSLEVLASESQADAVRDHLQDALGQDLRDHTEVSPLKDMGGGFKLVFNDEDVFYDFSDKALAEILCMFVNPRIAEIVHSEIDMSDELDSRGGTSAESSPDDAPSDDVGSSETE